MLWGKGKNEETSENVVIDTPQSTSSSITTLPSGGTRLENTWTSMFAATNADSEKMNKFQRLMGMKKGNLEGVSKEVQNQSLATCPEGPLLNTKDLEMEKRRQQEMTEQLDRQYALARATTHRGRGRGLGFM